MSLSIPNKEKSLYNKERLFELAKFAIEKGEVPVACIIEKDGEIIAEAFNLKETEKKVHYHAEILAIERASEKLNNWRLSDCTLIVTLEPCVMCMGAILAARISKLVYFLYDYNEGGINGKYSLPHEAIENSGIEIVSGLYLEESKKLMQNFFEKKRKK